MGHGVRHKALVAQTLVIARFQNDGMFFCKTNAAHSRVVKCERFNSSHLLNQAAIVIVVVVVVVIVIVVVVVVVIIVGGNGNYVNGNVVHLCCFYEMTKFLTERKIIKESHLILEMANYSRISLPHFLEKFHIVLGRFSFPQIKIFLVEICVSDQKDCLAYARILVSTLTIQPRGRIHHVSC